ncbi:MAG TPA: HD domain-containing protein [Vicinamibacterales bacterium]|nr:HD domain-containing protein [Vicinamibacterales bacterium]
MHISLFRIDNDEVMAEDRYILFDERTRRVLRRLLQRKAVTFFLPPLRQHHRATHDHSIRVGELAVDVALENGISVRNAERIGTAALLHDIGKTVVRRELLEKNGPLEPHETEEFRQHARAAHIALARRVHETIRNIVVAHHELKRRSPYPRSQTTPRRQRIRPVLSNRRRPSELGNWVQIVAAVDIFDALVSSRPYKQPIALDRLRETMLEEFAGTPTLVEQLVRRRSTRSETA